MMLYLFNYWLSDKYPGFCQVHLLMSLSFFKKYLSEVYLYLDDEFSLCGLTEDSADVCNHCLLNKDMVESYKCLLVHYWLTYFQT